MLLYSVRKTRSVVGDIVNEKELSQKLTSLPAPMREYAKQGKDLKTRVDRLAALRLLCNLLAEHGFSLDQKILRDADGRPYLESSEVDFNISHSEGFVAVAIGDGRVGIDLQAVNFSFDPVALADRFFAPEEAAAVAADENKPELFFRLWTQKEALGKAMGGGLRATLRKLPDSSAERHTKILTEDGKPFVLSVCKL